MSFLKDFENNVAPSADQGTGENSSGGPEDQNTPGSDPGSVTLQDMKDYFEAMKKGLMDDFRKEIEELRKTSDPDPDPEAEKGGKE
jgi:hypothetical protein